MLGRFGVSLRGRSARRYFSLCALLLGGGVVALSCARSPDLILPHGGSGGAAGVDGSVSGGAAGTAAAGGQGGSSAGGASGAGGAGGSSTGGSSAGGSGTGGSGTGGSGTGGSGTGGSGTGGSGTGGSGTGGSGTGGSGTGGSGTGGSGTGGSGTGGSSGCAIKSFDFASCTGSFTHGGTNDGWRCGVPNSGPNADHDGGGQLWATNLSGNANTCEDSWLESPAIDLSAYSGQALRVRFWHWHAFRACNPNGFLCGPICLFDKSQYSGGLIEVYDGSQWHKVTPTAGYNGTAINCYDTSPDAGPTCQPCSIDGQTGFDTSTNGSWQLAEADISSYAVAGFKVRFHFASYDIDPFCHPNTAGWYIDDVSIVPVGCP